MEYYFLYVPGEHSLNWLNGQQIFRILSSNFGCACTLSPADDSVLVKLQITRGIDERSHFLMYAQIIQI